ncbi:hypothetical protein KFK14_11525 [Sphingobium phenoxybenzoativorans]|uniref:Uncharacterized protein n=1 Tax=Sphingobium phenoxybenzoativorans TaxID=1592790 RepID=A0A975KCX7_9SPHN|nr:hypothetical protein [Sphingobium phenoxybenzoativorans]QUT07957.1 hypothetical protein KFK14_11525 [Sphingobium phenoxybenzoativorans]
MSSPHTDMRYGVSPSSQDVLDLLDGLHQLAKDDCWAPYYGNPQMLLNAAIDYAGQARDPNVSLHRRREHAAAAAARLIAHVEYLDAQLAAGEAVAA